MNIGMMSAWNEDSGASIHAESIGREWIKMGHELSVFSFLGSDFHGTAVVADDEYYVSRCFSTSRPEHPFLNVHPILKTDYDIFVTQDLGMLPEDELAKIFHLISRRAKTVNIIHHDGLPSNPSFYQFDWDAIVCFDDRYYSFLSESFPRRKLYVIPYPCYPLRKGDKFEARKKLELCQDRYILLFFGQRAVQGLVSLLPILENISRSLPILLLVLSKRDLKQIKWFNRNGLDILVKEEVPDMEKLYDYLHASDVLLYHRTERPGVVVSSTACQCLGSACPILAPKSNYLYDIERVVFTYANPQEFHDNLVEILNQGPRYHKWEVALEDYLGRNCASSVAYEYIRLFRSLLKEKAEEKGDFERIPRTGPSSVGPVDQRPGRFT